MPYFYWLNPVVKSWQYVFTGCRWQLAAINNFANRCAPLRFNHFRRLHETFIVFWLKCHSEYGLECGQLSWVNANYLLVHWVRSYWTLKSKFFSLEDANERKKNFEKVVPKKKGKGKTRSKSRKVRQAFTIKICTKAFQAYTSRLPVWQGHSIRNVHANKDTRECVCVCMCALLL